jgi:hypothetical protein
MIIVERTPAGDAQIRLQLSNGWSVAIMPDGTGKATLATWASWDDQPKIGVLRAFSADATSADELAEFLTHIGKQPRAGALLGKKGTVIIDEYAMIGGGDAQ